MKPKIAVVGGGSWATAIIKMLSDNPIPKEIFWWMRCADSVAHVQKYKHNPRYLSSVAINLPEENISTDLKSSIAQADFVLLCVPAAFLKEALTHITPEDFKGKKVISAIKGIVPNDNQIIGEFLNQHYHVHLQDILVISGPCHAEEVALEKLSYLTISSPDITLAEQFAAMLATRSIKTNVSEDIYGTEYAAVLKNIYATLIGISTGIGMSENAVGFLAAESIIKEFTKILPLFFLIPFSK
jgi:glycerol-3-phosphate dehydrogenase (NAD(P)+)